MLFDEEPARKAALLMEDMSINDLKARIEWLSQEIAACQSQIARKEATRKAAEAAFFKS